MYQRIFDSFSVSELTAPKDPADPSRGNRHLYDTPARRSYFWSTNGHFVSSVVLAISTQRNAFAHYLKTNVVLLIDWVLGFTEHATTLDKAIERQNIATSMIISLVVGRKNPELWDKYGKWLCTLGFSFRNKKVTTASFSKDHSTEGRSPDFFHLCAPALVKLLHGNTTTQLCKPVREALCRIILIKQIVKNEFGKKMGSLAPSIGQTDHPNPVNTTGVHSQDPNSQLQARCLQLILPQFPLMGKGIHADYKGDPAESDDEEDSTISVSVNSATHHPEKWTEEVLRHPPISLVNKYVTKDITTFMQLKDRVRDVERPWEVGQEQFSSCFKYVFPSDFPGMEEDGGSNKRAKRSADTGTVVVGSGPYSMQLDVNELEEPPVQRV